MKNSQILLKAIAATAVLWFFSAHGETQLREGLWKIFVEMAVTGGVGPPNPGPLTRELCLRPDEFPLLSMPPGSPCKVVINKNTPSKLAWNMQCDQSGILSRGNGEIKFSGNRFEGILDMETAAPVVLNIRQRLHGTRIGKCTPSSASPGKAGKFLQGNNVKAQKNNKLPAYRSSQ